MHEHGLRCWQSVPHAMGGAHRHQELEWNLIERGAVLYLCGGARVRVEAGQLAVFWGAAPHQLLEVGGAARGMWATLPLSTFLSWELAPGWVQNLLRGAVVVSEIDETGAAQMRGWERDLAMSDAAREKIVLLEMQARLRRLSLCSAQILGRPEHLGRGESGKLERMAAFMAQHFADPIRIIDIARAAELHPNYAMTLFKREFGLSLGEFLLRTRLADAQRLLATTDETVARIAARAGFGSTARFHAVWKRELGETPAKYRARMRLSS